MDISFSDLKEKEIINVFDGRKLGRIVDLLFDGSSGVVRGLVVPGERKMFRRNDDVFISLDRIRKIGDDVILISFPVQNQNVFTGQLSNSYADTYMPSQISYSKNKKIKNSGNYYSQNSKLNVVSNKAYGNDNNVNVDLMTRRKAEGYFEGLGDNKKSFVRYKRIDNKKYK